MEPLHIKVIMTVNNHPKMPNKADSNSLFLLILAQASQATEMMIQ